MAIYAKEQWTRNVEQHLENITQTFAGQTLNGREPFDTLGPEGPVCMKPETVGVGKSHLCGFYHFAQHEKGNCRVIVIGSGNKAS